jgi:hypothetical protein
VTADALLAELDGVGIHVTREGDNLRVRAELGISLVPYVERIAAQKPALLRVLRQRRIIAALDVEPEDFKCEEYDRLWVIWHTQDAKEPARS